MAGTSWRWAEKRCHAGLSPVSSYPLAPEQAARWIPMTLGTSPSAGKHRDDNRRSAEPMTDSPELRKRAANFLPLSPVSFLARAADFFGDRVAVIHGALRFTYRDFYARSRQLAHAL